MADLVTSEFASVWCRAIANIHTQTKTQANQGEFVVDLALSVIDL